jgi:hypothetical protein
LKYLINKLKFHRKSKILTDTNQYPDNKLTEQQTSEGCGGEKSDETCEKYVIEKPEGVKDEYEEEGDGKRDDSEKVKSADKKNGIEKLPPGWERHEGKTRKKHSLTQTFLNEKIKFNLFFHTMFDR